MDLATAQLLLNVQATQVYLVKRLDAQHVLLERILLEVTNPSGITKEEVSALTDRLRKLSSDLQGSILEPMHKGSTMSGPMKTIPPELEAAVADLSSSVAVAADKIAELSAQVKAGMTPEEAGTVTASLTDLSNKLKAAVAPVNAAFKKP